MRNYLLAAVAAAALTTPAMAREDSVYVGVDAGVMLVEDTNLDYNRDFDDDEIDDLDIDDALTIGVVAAVLGLVAGLGCVVPAWRMTKISPMDALRWRA